jgi:hypothetical protein
MAATQRLHYKDILVSKASTALLASRALSSGIDHLFLREMLFKFILISKLEYML